MARKAAVQKRSRRAAAKPKSVRRAQPAAEPKRRGRPPREVPPALAKAIESATTLLATAGSEDAVTRYKVAQIVVNLKAAPDKYGERAVETFGRAVKIGAKTLYRYADVVDAWEAKEFQGLAQRHGPTGRPLRWSIFVELASVKERRARGLLVQSAFDEGLSVRAIRKVAAGKTDDDHSPADFLKSITKKAARLSAALANFGERTPETADHDLAECRNSLAELSEKLTETLEKMASEEAA